MRQSSTVLALAAIAACNPAEPASNTDSGAIIGGESGKVSLDTSATDAPSTGSNVVTSAPLPSTDSSVTSAAGTSTTTGGESSNTLHTTGSAVSATTGVITTGDNTTGDNTTGDITTGPDPIEPWAPKPCPQIYAQDLLPTFELEIASDELSALKSEWKAAKNNSPEHPLKSFKFADTVITNATVRLRGNPTWWSGQGKMQFAISFNSVDPKGRFMGRRKLLFDAADKNKSFMRDRLAMTVLQDVGLPSPCANNARLTLNGKYYGLFTSIEKIDKELIERHFEDPEGNIYERNDWERKNNEMDMNTSDLDALLAAKSVDSLAKPLNLDEAVLEWAAEAVMPDGDGAWAGGLNYYIYNDSKTGFNVIPWDKDATFTRLDFDTDPYTFIKPGHHGRVFYDIVTDDEQWFKKYIDAIAYVLEHGYKVDVLRARIDTWAAQIATAAAEDSNKPFSTEDHLAAVQEKRDYVAQRHAYIKAWLECWQNGGKKGKGGKCTPP